jgi:hypothetical protein
LQCRVIDGAWHLVSLKPLPAPGFNQVRCADVDIILHVPATQIEASEARRQYGAEVYAVAKRRLARRELGQYPIPATQR